MAAKASRTEVDKFSSIWMVLKELKPSFFKQICFTLSLSKLCFNWFVLEANRLSLDYRRDWGLEEEILSWIIW